MSGTGFLLPTFIPTPMTAPFFADPEVRSRTLARIPPGRVGEAQDLMSAVVFTPPSLMTGSALIVDDGRTEV